MFPRHGHLRPTKEIRRNLDGSPRVQECPVRQLPKGFMFLWVRGRHDFSGCWAATTLPQPEVPNGFVGSIGLQDVPHELVVMGSDPLGLRPTVRFRFGSPATEESPDPFEEMDDFHDCCDDASYEHPADVPQTVQQPQAPVRTTLREPQTEHGSGRNAWPSLATISPSFGATFGLFSAGSGLSPRI